MICKFIGVSMTERDMVKWIQHTWQPKGHIELKLGPRGFFTVIFGSLEDKERVFNGSPYLYNGGLFMRNLEERYNPDL